MTWNLRNGLFTLFIFVIEIIIAVFVKDHFIRPFFGDFLAVILLYFFARTFFKTGPIKIGLMVYLFALLLETLQYFQILTLFGATENTILRIVLGSTFDWLDILAYTLGVPTALFLDRIINKAHFQRLGK